MEGEKMTFGKYLAHLRESKDFTLRELASRIGVSAPFLSDVEKDRRGSLIGEKLEQVIRTLDLNNAEKTKLYDLAGEQRNTIAPDLPDYIMERKYVTVALRTARDLDAGKEEWNRFIAELKKKKG